MKALFRINASDIYSGFDGMFWASMIILAESAVALVVNLYLLIATRWLRKPVTVTLILCVSLTASDALCALCYMLSMVIQSLILYVRF